MNRRSSLQFSPGAAGPVLAADDDWRGLAACGTADPELFFAEDADSRKQAAGICAGCPVRSACLSFALANDIRCGVWGGTALDGRGLMSAPDRPRYCKSGRHRMDAANTDSSRACRVCRRDREARNRAMERLLRTGSTSPRSGYRNAAKAA